MTSQSNHRYKIQTNVLTTAKMDKQLKRQTDRKREILKGTVRHTRADIQPERDKETERIGKQTG